MSDATPPRETPSAPNPVVRVGSRMAAAFAAFLILILAAGFLLSGTWSAEARLEMEVPPAAVFELIDSPRRWEEWSPWPQVTSSYHGPSRGEGAVRRWEGPQVGRGSFTITASEPPRLLRYRVEVDGDLTTDGTFRLEPTGTGTRVTWSEEGDFGWNPLMGWAALFMERAQGAQLEGGLGRLEAAARGEPLPRSP